MDMKGKTKSIKLGLEILTPVQCGSGRELFKEIDYVIKDNQVFVVDQTRSFNEIASGDDELDNKLLAGDYNLSDVVELAGEHYGYVLQGYPRAGNTPEKIREHLKGALFQPYIAGSAIKGAISTALIAEYLRQQPKTFYEQSLPKVDARTGKPAVSKVRAAQKLIKTLLSEDPKENIFRALLVKDALFTPDQLCLVDIRWLNLTKNKDKITASWRSMSKKQSFAEWVKADGIQAEMLKPQSEAAFQLQWDEFLLSDRSLWKATTHDILPNNFESLKTRLNQHSAYRLQQEIEFYQRYGAIHPKQECEKLLQKIQKTTDSIYLQLSWGSGWCGMTGDWMQPEIVGQMREVYKLGKDNMPFPKTRRLAVSGEPKLPLGWVRLFPYAQIEEKLKQKLLEENLAIQSNQQEQQRLASLSPLEKELEALLKVRNKSEWDSLLFQELEKSRWTGDEAKQVAEKVKQLMIDAEKWMPTFPGTNKQKLKYKERSIKVKAIIDGNT